MNEPMMRGDFTGGFRPQNAPDNRFITFAAKSVPDKAKSIAEGRPMFMQRIFITIQTPGDNLNVPTRVATDADIAEFPRQWAAFQAGREAIPEGTLLSVMFPNNPELVDMFRAQKIFVIEQIASMADGEGQRFMGFQKMKQDAQAFLKAADGSKDFHVLRNQVEKLTLEMKALSDRNAALETALAKKETDDGEPAKRKPGRPPNPPTAA